MRYLLAPVLLLVAWAAPLHLFADSNFISNPSLETASGSTPQSWSTGMWGTLKATFSYPTGGAHSGSRYVKTEVTQAGTGDAKWFPAQISITGGSDYTFSDWYQASVATEIDANFILADGSNKFVWLADLPPASSWSQARVTFTAPANATAMKVYHLIDAVGSLSLDDYALGLAESATTTPPPPPPPVQKPVINSFSASPTTIVQGQSATLSWSVASATSLTIDQGIGSVSGTSKTVSPAATTTYTLTAANSGGTTTATAVVNVAIPQAPPPPPPPPSGNLIQNGDFESGSTNNPTGWSQDYWGSLTPKFTYPVVGKGGGKAGQVKVTNYASGDAKWDFTPVTVSSHTMYQFDEDYQANVKTNLTLEYQKSDGSYVYEWLGDLPAASSWTHFGAQITIPTGVVSLRVFHSLISNGTLSVDNFSLVPLSASDSSFAQGLVTFVFDDGLLSQYQNAVPILKQAGMSATFGIITTEPASGDPEAMTWAQVKDLAAKGYEVDSHTRTHPDLTTLTTSKLTNEVNGSKNNLESRGITPTTFVYPYGATNTTVEAAVKAAGYAGARGSGFGLNTPVTDHYNLYDIRLDANESLSEVTKLIDQAVQDKRWLIFEIHDVVATGGDSYAITPAYLQSVVDYVRSKNVSVVTLGQGISQLNP